MPVYTYNAREAGTGRETGGDIDAPNEQAATAALRARNLFVLSIRERPAGGSESRRRVKLLDISAFTRQLASMLDAGLTILQALQTLASQATNRSMQRVITDIISSIDTGDSLAGALSKHPEVFNRLYVNMVDAGERGGILPEILERMATHSERTQKLQSKLRSSMIYPAVITLVAVAVTLFLMIKVVPTFGTIFEEQGASLPAFTQFVISLSGFLGHNAITILISLLLIFFGLRTFIRTTKGRERWDKFKLKLPIFGPIFHQLALTRFARTTASLVHSGVPILEVLSIVATTVDNVQMELAIKESATRIEQGDTLSGALSAYPIFPRMILRMIAAGEQGGAVDTMLEKVSDYMETELENKLNALTSLIEPILIVGLGIMIGGLVLAMFLPIFDMINHVR